MSTENKYFPEFGGSTGGWLQAAETEEKYVMTWVNDKKKEKPEENTFEFQVNAISHRYRNQLKYRYQLLGYDKKYRKDDNLFIKKYTGLI
jgi:hypothetical protein